MIPRILWAHAAGAALAFLAGCATPQPRPAEHLVTSLRLAEDIDAIAEAARVELELPGVSIVLLQGDRVLLARGYGFADVENAIAATEHTVYGIGSLSKQFAAAAIMRLLEQGQVGLDDLAHTHLPEFIETGSHITIRHLLRQTSGLPDYASFREIAQMLSLIHI